MGAVSTTPYTAVTVTGYNSGPPSDDGAQTPSNQVTWSGIKTKLGDPLNTYAAAENSALVTAFAKTVNTDADVGSQISGALAFQWATATIGTDVVAPSFSAMALGAESGATADTLQSISATATAVYSGMLLVIKQRNATEEINVIHATSTAATATNPNIFLAGRANYSINTREKSLTLQYDAQVATSTGWYEVARGAPLTATGAAAGFTITQSSTITGVITLIPRDDSTPDDGEGDQVITISHSPLAVGNTLLFDFNAIAGFTATTDCSAALFATTATSAKSASVFSGRGDAGGTNHSVRLCFATVATATTSRTWQVRCGPTNAITCYIGSNSNTATMNFGDTVFTTLAVTEFAA